jgi:uncharacterized membrane protein
VPGYFNAAAEAMNLFMLSTGIVLLTLFVVYWLNRQQISWVQQLLNWFPAILFAYVIPAAITHSFKLDLSEVYLHSLSRNWIIPFAIMMVMSALSIPQLKKVGAKPIILFGMGSFVIALLPPVLVWVSKFVSPPSYELFIDQQYWRGFVPIVGSWVGGSTSQLVLKELVQCPESLFLSVIVLDNILVNLWTIFMFQVIKRSDSINKMFNITSEMPETEQLQETAGSRMRASIITTMIAITAAVIFVNLITDVFLYRVLILSLLGLMLGNFIPNWNHEFVLKAGGLFIITIMAILGLRLDFAGLSLPISFVVVCLVWLAGHYVVMVFAAKALRLHMAWVPIASMANLGGISTAPAVTSAYNKKWMPHAILLAILSMVTGNLWGMFTLFLFEHF